MKKTGTIALGLIFTAAASWAATEVLVPDAPTVIEISVAPHELADCQATLAQVAQQPAVHDNGSPMFFDFSDDLPSVKCVADQSA